MEKIIDFIGEAQQTAFDDLLEETAENIIPKMAALVSTTNYIEEVEAIGIDIPDAVLETRDNLETELKDLREDMREKFNKRLDDNTTEEASKLVKKTKFASRKELSGQTFLLKNTREIANRLNEETAETLVRLSPEKVVEKVEGEDHEKIERFVTMYKPRKVSSDIEAWIDRNVPQEKHNMRCKEHYEEMKSEILTDDIIKGVAVRWVNMGIEKRNLSEEETEKVKEEIELLEKMLKKEMTVL